MRNKVLLLLLLLGTIGIANAQVQHPIKWAYGKKKIGTDTYEIHLKATIQTGWHVYAQLQPDNSVSQPTTFKFKTGNDFTLIGKVKELGTLIKFEDPGSGLGANEYSNIVDFVQVIKLKNPAATVVGVTITYQACTDHMCLSPEDVSFNIPIK